MPRKKKLSNEANSNKTETIEKRKDALKEIFLEKIQDSIFVSLAAMQTGIDRTTYYRWKKEDHKFAQAVDRQQMKGRDKANDIIESVLLKNAKSGDVKSIFFWLKHNHQQYADRIIVRHDDLELSDKEKREIERILRVWSGVGGRKTGDRFIPTLEQRGIKKN